MGLQTIAKFAPELLPDIASTGIEDESKANGLAKFLVCLQACWFIIQSVERLVVGLPISLLEMNTLLPVFMCFFIYLARWHKPLDIDEPYPIDSTHGLAQKVHAWIMVYDAQQDELPAYVIAEESGET